MILWGMMVLNSVFKQSSLNLNAFNQCLSPLDVPQKLVNPARLGGSLTATGSFLVSLLLSWHPKGTSWSQGLVCLKGFRLKNGKLSKHRMIGSVGALDHVTAASWIKIMFHSQKNLSVLTAMGLKPSLFMLHCDFIIGTVTPESRRLSTVALAYPCLSLAGGLQETSWSFSILIDCWLAGIGVPRESDESWVSNWSPPMLAEVLNEWRTVRESTWRGSRRVLHVPPGRTGWDKQFQGIQQVLDGMKQREWVLVTCWWMLSNLWLRLVMHQEHVTGWSRMVRLSQPGTLGLSCTCPYCGSWTQQFIGCSNHHSCAEVKSLFLVKLANFWIAPIDNFIGHAWSNLTGSTGPCLAPRIQEFYLPHCGLNGKACCKLCPIHSALSECVGHMNRSPLEQCCCHRCLWAAGSCQTIWDYQSSHSTWNVQTLMHSKTRRINRRWVSPCNKEQHLCDV